MVVLGVMRIRIEITIRIPMKWTKWSVEGVSLAGLSPLSKIKQLSFHVDPRILIYQIAIMRGTIRKMAKRSMKTHENDMNVPFRLSFKSLATYFFL